MGNEYSTKIEHPPIITTSKELIYLVEGFAKVQNINLIPITLVRIIIKFYYGANYPSDVRIFGIGKNVYGCLTGNKAKYDELFEIKSIIKPKNIYLTQHNLYYWCYNNHLWFLGYAYIYIYPQQLYIYIYT